MMVEVIIIRHKNEQCSKLAAWLRSNGCTVHKEDDDIGFVEASVPQMLFPIIQKLPCVSYVRKVFEYESQIGEPLIVHPDDHL